MIFHRVQFCPRHLLPTGKKNISCEKVGFHLKNMNHPEWLITRMYSSISTHPVITLRRPSSIYASVSHTFLQLMSGAVKENQISCNHKGFTAPARTCVQQPFIFSASDPLQRREEARASVAVQQFKKPSSTNERSSPRAGSPVAAGSCLGDLYVRVMSLGWFAIRQ